MNYLYTQVEYQGRTYWGIPGDWYLVDDEADLQLETNSGIVKALDILGKKMNAVLVRNKYK